jgi:hypothetical protein
MGSAMFPKRVYAGFERALEEHRKATGLRRLIRKEDLKPALNEVTLRPITEPDPKSGITSKEWSEILYTKVG